MSFDTNVISVWTLNQSLEEEVANNTMVPVGALSAQYVQYQHLDLLTQTYETKFGLLFQEGIYYESSQAITLSDDDLYISFWWYSPSTVGFTRHSVTRKLTPKVAPIISKANTDSGAETETVSNAQFIASEIGYSESQNAIRFQICEGNATPTQTIESEPYLPGLHHVALAYKRNSSESTSAMRVDIDGKVGTVYTWGSSSAVSNTSAKVRFNSVYNGLVAHKVVQNDAHISDVIILDTQGDNLGLSTSVYRFGWDSVAAINGVHLGYTFFGVGFNQPPTTTTNQIYAEGGNIYVARSNGEIRKGSRPIWDTEENFSSEIQGQKLSGTTVRI